MKVEEILLEIINPNTASIDDVSAFLQKMLGEFIVSGETYNFSIKNNNLIIVLNLDTDEERVYTISNRFQNMINVLKTLSKIREFNPITIR